MTLSEDEIREAYRLCARCSIDLNQAMNYFLDSKYENGYENLLDVQKSLCALIEMVHE